MSTSVQAGVVKCKLTPKVHEAEAVLHVLDACEVQYSIADVRLSASGSYPSLKSVNVDVPRGSVSRVQQYLSQQNLGSIVPVESNPEGE